MKILFVTASFLKSKDDKILDAVYEFVSSFEQKGHEGMVVSAHCPGIPREDVINGIRVKRFVYFYPEKLEKLAYGVGIPSNIRESNLAKIQIIPYVLCCMNKVREAINEFKPDVVHAIWAFPQGTACALLKKLKPFPLVVSVVGSEAYLAKRFHFPSLVSFAANSADTVTANSIASKNAAIRCGVKNKDFEIIYWGIDKKRFNPKVSRTELRKRLKLGNRKIILTVAKLIEKKGVRYLIQAMPAVLKKFPDAKLVIGGDGPQKEELQQLAKNLNLQNSVIFLGWVSMDDLPICYRAADVFVLAAATDELGVPEGGQALVTKQAMASGTAVISTNIGGIPDLVKNNKTGLLVEEKNPEQLGEAIIRILGDKKLRQNLIRNAHKLVEREATWDVIIEKYIKLYSRVIKKQGRLPAHKGGAE